MSEPLDPNSNSTDIFFLCENCGQEMVIVAEAAGMTIDCPNCGIPAVVPTPNVEVANPAGEIAAEPAQDLFDMPLSAMAIGILERCLVAVVGPIGSPLAKNAVSQAATSDELWEMLLACIPSANDQAAFIEVCRREAENAGRLQEAEEVASQMESASPGWDQAMLDAVSRNLANYLGPIAPIMVQRASAKSKSIADLYKRLAAAIPDASDRGKFLLSAPTGIR